MSAAPERYDVLVIGAGIGGLIAAAQLGQAGRRVLLAENLSFLGGRFTAFPVDGMEISSGAFHTFPHGNSGPAAAALRRTHVHIDIPAPKIFGSFHVDGRHIVAHSGFGVFKAVPRQADKLMLWRALLQSWAQKRFDGSAGEWLEHIGASKRVRDLFDRFCQFALSTTIYDMPYAEGREIIRMTLRYGLPGVPVGGARAVAKQLGRAARDAGVTLRKHTQVQTLLTEGGRVCGALLHDRRRDATYEVATPRIISNAGPGNTFALAQQAGLTELVLPSPPPATGLKIQVLSPKSLIAHDAIMFCLDTRRVAGILQATNVDSDLAPAGKHLLISHQVTPPGADWQTERDLALDDWRYLFGDDFEQCEVLGVSHFPARFPVNWATQGGDLRSQPLSEKGLWLVGDGLKPPGLMMVEGVAASAESAVRQILGHRNTRPWEISLGRWLLKRLFAWRA